MLRGRRSRVELLAPAALVLAFAWAGAGVASAAPADVTFEGETMSLPPSDGDDVWDGQASGNYAQRIWSNATATKVVTTTRSSVHLFVRARGDECVGAPEISVKVGGKLWYAGPVNTSGPPAGPSEYRWIGVRVSIPAGSHTVSISMTNDYVLETGGVKVCDRNAYIDTVTIVATPFSPTGWRNKPLPADAPIDSSSTVLVAELKDQIDDDLGEDGDGTGNNGVWVANDSYTTTVYTVPPDQPTVKVDPSPWRADLMEQWSAVPLPPAAQPSDGEDFLVVWQPSTDTLWEFIGLHKQIGGNWAAWYGGRMRNVSQHQGHFEDPPLGPGSGFGATATSISPLAGMQRIEEVRRGVEDGDVGAIDHAIDVGIVGSRVKDAICWPAQRSDGSSRDPAAIAEGMRFRFPATLNLDAYGLHPYARLVAEAIKRYGMVVRDRTSLVGFWAEDPTPTGENPYWGLWDFKYPNAKPDGVFAGFPWDKLQALAPAGTGCRDDPDQD